MAARSPRSSTSAEHPDATHVRPRAGPAGHCRSRVMGWTHERHVHPLPPGAARARGRGPAARRAPAAGGRPRGRPPPRARRARHRQDDDAGRGDRRSHRAARRLARRGARAHLLPQGCRAAARPGHRPCRPHDGGGVVLDVPLLRLRPRAEVRTGRALRGSHPPAVRARGRRRAARAAARQPRVGRVARAAAPGRRHAGLRARGAGRPGARPREGPRPVGAACPRHRARPPGAGGRRPLPRAVPHRPRQPRRHRLLRPDPPRRDRGRDPPRRAAGALAARLRRRIPGHRPRPGRPAPRARRRRPRPHRGG